MLRATGVLGVWLHPFILPPSSYGLLPCVYLSVIYKYTAIRFKGHIGNLERSHLKTNIIFTVNIVWETPIL